MRINPLARSSKNILTQTYWHEHTIHTTRKGPRASTALETPSTAPTVPGPAAARTAIAGGPFWLTA